MGELDLRTDKEIFEELQFRSRTQKYRNYEPIGKMEEYLDKLGSGKYIVSAILAANGIGKTTAMVNFLAHLIWPCGNKYFQQPLLKDWPYPKTIRIASDPETLKSTIIPMIQEWFPQDRYTQTKAGKTYMSRFTTDNGWSITCMSYEQSSKEFESSTLGLILCDEPPPEPIHKANVARLRKGGMIGIFATPLIGSAWLYDEIIASKDSEKEFRTYVTAEVEDACFGLDTEVMTPTGWKWIDQINKGEKVYGVDVETGELLIEAVQRRVFYSSKPVTRINNGIVCTLDHEVSVYKETGEGKNIQDLVLKRVQVKDLYRGNRLIKKVASSSFGVSIMPHIPQGWAEEVWASFVGWYLSDGCCTGSGGGKQGKNQIYITQTKPETKAILEILLGKTPLDWKYRKSGDFWTTDKEVHDMLLRYGGSEFKYIPNYFFTASESIRRRLFEGLMYGDGSIYKHGFRYSSVSSVLADDVQRLAISLGYIANIGVWQGGEKRDSKTGKDYIHKPSHVVNISSHDSLAYVTKKPSVIGETAVACITVPSSNLIVRNAIEKKPLVLGNCIEHGVRGFLKHSDIVKMVSQYKPEDMQARVFGKFQHLTGLIFKDFSQDIHVISPFELNRDDYVVYQSWDTHPRENEAIIWVAVDRKGTKYVVDELWSDAPTEELVARIKTIDAKYRIVSRVLDPLGFIEDKRTNLSFAKLLSATYGLVYQPASKRRMDGIVMIQDALNYQLMGSDMIRPPGMYYMNHCSRTIWETLHWQWQEYAGKSQERHKRSGTPQDKDDHFMEALGRVFLDNAQFQDRRESIVERSLDRITQEVEDDPFN